MATLQKEVEAARDVATQSKAKVAIFRDVAETSQREVESLRGGSGPSVLGNEFLLGRLQLGVAQHILSQRPAPIRTEDEKQAQETMNLFDDVACNAIIQAAEEASLENTAEALSQAQIEIQRLRQEVSDLEARAAESPTRETLLAERDEMNRNGLLHGNLLDERDELNRSLLVLAQERDAAHRGALLAQRERDQAQTSLQATRQLATQLEEVCFLCGRHCCVLTRFCRSLNRPKRPHSPSWTVCLTMSATTTATTIGSPTLPWTRLYV